MQVLHSGGNHWVTISTVGCPPSTIKVFDSLYSTIPTHTKEQICALLMSMQATINVQYVGVQKQRSGCNCGLYALAFATAICAGEMPQLLQFDEKVMRSHLLRCLEEEDIIPFPSTKVSTASVRVRSIIRTDVIEIFCSCRTQEGGKMIACDGCAEWYHFNCISTSKRLSKKWYCTNCKTN